MCGHVAVFSVLVFCFLFFSPVGLLVCVSDYVFVFALAALACLCLWRAGEVWSNFRGTALYDWPATARSRVEACGSQSIESAELCAFSQFA